MNPAAILLAAETAGEEGKPFHTPEAGELFNFAPLYDGAPEWLTYPMVVMTIVTILLGYFFWRAFAQPKVVPVGAQNVGEAGIEFVQKQIAGPVLGPDLSARWLPYLTAVFFWVLFLNLMGIVPGIQFPITSRMAIPTLLAILAWVIYNAIGIRNQGFVGYFKNVLFPPGVPKLVYVLLTPIELVSTLIIRPLTLALRLFANMVAGHMLLTVLFIATGVFISGSVLGKIAFVVPLGFGTVMMGFEVFVAFMQAFIITILTAVYIAGAQEAHH